MKIALVQFTPWDKFYYVDTGGFSLKGGDLVVVNTDYGFDAGKVSRIIDWQKPEKEEKEGEKVFTIERVATGGDQDVMKDLNGQKEKTMDYCRALIKKHNLAMKLVDCYFSLDDKRLTFAFISDGRVDFRDLVKELTRHFQKNIRLHQLGVRDEAKMVGDVGCCGLKICCRSYLKDLVSVTSDFAEKQQVAHRGSERLSGICGRLKCCLAYEKDLYEELAKNLPPIGTRVKTDHGRGEIIGWHVLKRSVDVRLDPEKPGERSAIVQVVIKS